ncbi:unnamed protein product [Mytilus edulis]|uniref:Uncharacterized protein n=1 Tax=Mytilus edulis TaxID=6550 RepID=A0A8S3QVN6_MYTED|nr:unnamed protein product [Mytilus edulis]
MLIPFEKIDLALCRKAAYCTIFITSRERMHFWLHALGQSIIIGNKNNPSVKVDWHDSTTQGITERTEFEVHSSESIGDYEGDTLMYKVIVPDHRNLSTNLEIVSTNSEILQQEDQIKLKTPPEKVPITPVLQAKNENITINTDSNNSISNDPHSESSEVILLSSTDNVCGQKIPRCIR